MARWEDWRRRHPETRVLSIETGHTRSYEPGAAYANYFASPGTMFPAPRTRTELPEKARVFGLRVDGAAKAWELSRLAEQKVWNDAVGGVPVVLVAGRGTIAASGHGLRGGFAEWDAGGEVRAYRRGARRFDPSEAADTVRDGAGTHWRVTEDALVSPAGDRAERAPGVLSYWFGWSAFVPRTELWKGP